MKGLLTGNKCTVYKIDNLQGYKKCSAIIRSLTLKTVVNAVGSIGYQQVLPLWYILIIIRMTLTPGER